MSIDTRIEPRITGSLRQRNFFRFFDPRLSNGYCPMTTTAPLKAGIAAAACSILLTACAKDLPELPVYAPATASVPTPPSETGMTTNPENEMSISQALAFVASDLVAGLSFISGVSPNLVSLKIPAEDTEFDELVKTAMMNKGYSIDNRFDRSGSEQLATSFLKRDRGDSSYVITGIISINSVLVKRSYLVKGTVVEAQTSYLIRGISPQLVSNSEQVRVL